MKEINTLSELKDYLNQNGHDSEVIDLAISSNNWTDERKRKGYLCSDEYFTLVYTGDGRVLKIKK